MNYFSRLLMDSDELRLFDKVRIYLDEDYSSAEKFTALGNFYFIHKSITNILTWDFQAMQFVSVEDKKIHSGNIEEVATKEKSKFPQDFFPECKWSRKGFLRTRWSLNGTIFDLINIHLFHDASNFVAMESFPSSYCKNRRRALEHTLDRFHSDINGTAPFFLFGDFNFRTDTQGVVKKLAEGLNAVSTMSKKCNREECTKLQYQDTSSQVILSVGKKEFSHQDHQTVFMDTAGTTWLKEYDRELESFTGRLFEFEITFPPSYPFEEDESGARSYMPTRCPAWCDRVVLSHPARELVDQRQENKPVEYGLMGKDTCMGDHKPVYLMLRLVCKAGRIHCCVAENPCSLLLLAVTYDDESSLPSTPEPSLHQSMHASPCMPPKFQRAHSTPAVEQPLHALSRTKCRCLSESASWQQQQQHRLTPSRHLLRVSSHHSSSDEEWFEFVNASTTLNQHAQGSRSFDSALQSSLSSVISTSTFPVLLGNLDNHYGSLEASLPESNNVSNAYNVTNAFSPSGDLNSCVVSVVMPNKEVSAISADPVLSPSSVTTRDLVLPSNIVVNPKYNDKSENVPVLRKQKCCSLI